MIRKIYKIFFIPIAIIYALSISGCTKEILHVKDVEFKDGEYDSEFPVKPTSDGLDEIMSSVKLISTIAFYESFEFDVTSQLKVSDINEDNIKQVSISKYHFNQPATGTATVIYNANRMVGLLTCAHIVHFADTLIAYHRNPDGQETEFVQSMAFKIRQNINIVDFLLGNDFEILAMDKKNDIALIGKHLKIDTPFTIPVFKFPRGKSSELRWGTFLYVLGFPRGEKLVTRAIVSQPPDIEDDSFVIDAVFNRGFSGGIVIAIRDGVPNFELVGMAKSVPAETKLYLAPEKSYKILEASPQLSYSDNIRVNTYENIFYGITYVVTAESIGRFIEDNEEKLRLKGYLVDQFFPVK
jgi:hypothetical protein